MIRIEVLHSMDTYSFINSFRRFAARRGLPELVRSDNGTNCVAGNRELHEAIEESNKHQIKIMIQRNIKLAFNRPSASHEGGVWADAYEAYEEFSSLLLKNRR